MTYISPRLYSGNSSEGFNVSRGFIVMISSLVFARMTIKPYWNCYWYLSLSKFRYDIAIGMLGFKGGLEFLDVFTLTQEPIGVDLKRVDHIILELKFGINYLLANLLDMVFKLIETFVDGSREISSIGIMITKEDLEKLNAYEPV